MTLDRFHPPTLALGAAALALTLAVTGWSWRRETGADLEGWVGRAQTAAIVSASSIDDVSSAADVQARLNRMAEAAPEMIGISVLRPAAEAGRLVVVADWTVGGDAIAAGTVVGAAGPLSEGLEHATVVAETLTGYAPVKDADGNALGVLGVRLDPEPLLAQKGAATRTALAIAALASLGLGLLGAMAARRQEEPATPERRRIPDLEPPLRLADSEVVGRRFETLAKSLHERAYVRETFGRYVSQRVSDVLNAEHGAMVAVGEDHEVTLLRADFDRDALTGHVPAVDLLPMVNGWIGAMASVAEQHGGFVDFHGDAMTVVFGAPVPLPDHAERAVRCAAALRQRLAALVVEWEKNRITPSWAAGQPPKLRIALHRGPVMVGNFGNPQRVRYGVVGEAVEVCEGLESLHRKLGTEILMTADVLSALPAGSITPEGRGTHLVGASERLIYSF